MKEYATRFLLAITAACWFFAGGLPGVRVLASPPAGGPPSGEAAGAEPSLEKLAELNAGELFGGEVSASKGRITVRFPGGGLVERGFLCRGGERGAGVISDEAEVKSQAVRKLLLDGAKGKFSFVGFESGSAISRFELVDDFKISFRLRIRNLAATARITWQFHREGREYLQTSFFQDIARVGSKRAHARTKSARFMGPPARWFDTKSPGVPVEISFKAGKMTIRVGVTEPAAGARGKRGAKKGEPTESMVDVVTMDGIESPTKGKVALAFDRVTFLVTDFVITGKFPAEWVKAETDALKKAGKLITRSPDEVASEKETENTGGDSTASGPSGGEGSDLDGPDPEANDPL